MVYLQKNRMIINKAFYIIINIQIVGVFAQTIKNNECSILKITKK